MGDGKRTDKNEAQNVERVCGILAGYLCFRRTAAVCVNVVHVKSENLEPQLSYRCLERAKQ